MTGAAESLKTKCDDSQNNIEARNLLGLVYCEMGEVVEALSQWVISKFTAGQQSGRVLYCTDSVESGQV